MKKLLIRLLIRTLNQLGLDQVFHMVRKSVQGDQEWTITYPSDFVSYWYVYKIAKFLLLFLTPSTRNEYTVTDSFNFAEEFVKRP